MWWQDDIFSVSNGILPWQIPTGEEAASCTWEQPRRSLHRSCQGTRLEGVAGSLQNRSPTTPCIHPVSSSKAVCKWNWNSPALSLCYVNAPTKGLPRLLLSLMTPKQSKSGRFSYRETKAKKKNKFGDAYMSASPRQFTSMFAPSAERCCLLWICPALRGCPFGRQEVTYVWSSSCCCLRPWVWLQRHLSIVGLGGQDSGQHQLWACRQRY